MTSLPIRGERYRPYVLRSAQRFSPKTTAPQMALASKAGPGVILTSDPLGEAETKPPSHATNVT